jgi:AcrR family transcriptional regulator
VPKISPAHEQQRRAQILNAAMVCFARQGYHATSMDDVVRESGLSVGAIYSYFPSKEDLFLTLSDDRADQALAYMNDLFRRPGPMAEKTSEAVDYFFNLLSDELLSLARVNVEFMSEAAKSERVKERQERRCESERQFLRWILTEGRRQGEIRDDVDIEAAAELMMSLNEGILVMSVTGLRAISLERLKPAYLALLSAGLSTPSSTMFAPAELASAITPNGSHPKGAALSNEY